MALEKSSGEPQPTRAPACVGANRHEARQTDLHQHRECEMRAYRRSYKRLADPGGFYFFTDVTFGRRPILTSAPARHSLRLALRETKAKYPFQLAAVCLLPDHLHCIWRLPEGDADFSRRWAMIKGVFSRSFAARAPLPGYRNSSRRRKGEVCVRQRRFWEHLVRDEDDMRRHLDYIHYNPVKHGYVRRPDQWPWSSFGRYRHKGWYEPGWGDAEPENLKGMGDLGE